MNTAGCTTGWVNYANELSQAALERSNQDADDVIRLTRSKAAVWTADDVARLIEIKKKNSYLFIYFYPWWLGSRVFSVLDSGAEGSAFKSQPRRYRVTVLGKLFTPIVPLFTKQRNW